MLIEFLVGLAIATVCIVMMLRVILWGLDWWDRRKGHY